MLSRRLLLMTQRSYRHSPSDTPEAYMRLVRRRKATAAAALSTLLASM